MTTVTTTIKGLARGAWYPLFGAVVGLIAGALVAVGQLLKEQHEAENRSRHDA